MRIDELLARSGDPTFSFEFFPPKTPEGEENLYAALRELQPLEPAYVSVTYGAGGTTREKTIEIVSRIKESFGLEAMAHFTCVNATTDELRSALDQLRDAGVENVLALRGDPPQGEDRWTKTEGGLEYSRELVELLRSEYPAFAVARCRVPRDPHRRHLAGGGPAPPQGQGRRGGGLPRHPAVLREPLLLRVRRARPCGRHHGPDHSGHHADHEHRRHQAHDGAVGIGAPRWLSSRALEARRGDTEAVAELGVAYATLQCADLLAGGAPGIHFYTLNRSPATRAILSALKLWRPWERATGLAVAPERAGV